MRAHLDSDQFCVLRTPTDVATVLAMHPILEALWTQHGAASFAKARHVAELVEGLSWQVDLEAGEVYFGDEYAWKIQLLGSEGYAAGTWLWCWANEQMRNLPESVTHGARSLQAFGEQRNVPELQDGTFELGDVDGEFIAMIAAGALQAQCHVVLPYEGGRAFALVKDASFPALDKSSLLKAPATYMMFLEARSVSNHRKAWEHFLRFHLLDVTESSGTIRGDGSSGSLIGTFDEQGRLTNLKADLKN